MTAGRGDRGTFRGACEGISSSPLAARRGASARLPAHAGPAAAPQDDGVRAARGRGAAAVAAAVRGALRASTPTRTTRLFPAAASPGPPGFLDLDLDLFIFSFSSREDKAVVTKVLCGQ